MKPNAVGDTEGGIAVVRLLGKAPGRESDKKKQGNCTDQNQTLATSTQHAS